MNISLLLMPFLLLLYGCTNKKHAKDTMPYKYVTFDIPKDVNDNNPIKVTIISLNTGEISDMLQSISGQVSSKIQNKIQNPKSAMDIDITNLADEFLDKTTKQWSFELVEGSISSYLLVDYTSKDTKKCIAIVQYTDHKIKVVSLGTAKDRSVVTIEANNVDVKKSPNKPSNFTFIRSDQDNVIQAHILNKL